MATTNLKKYGILGVLFFLPVTFLLFLYPSTHNYNALDIVNNKVEELPVNSNNVQLKDQITVLGFFGKQPLEKAITASNLKELVYDKFLGFKKFQIVILVSEGTEEEVRQLTQEIRHGDEFKYWRFVYATDSQIKRLHASLETEITLSPNLSTDTVYLVDKDMAQRGRLDDREDTEKEKKKPAYRLLGYDCIEVSEIKNKMSDDLRILFTEYRQKRKGNFDSTSRRADDLKNEL
jgi:hypothetical protein